MKKSKITKMWQSEEIHLTTKLSQDLGFVEVRALILSTGHQGNIKILNMVGPSGWPEVKLTGTKANLTNVLQAEHGWGDPSLATFIEDSIH